MLAVTTQAEPTADDDRSIAARYVQLVHGLRIEARRAQALSLSPLAAELEHVGRDVRAVDVEPGLEVRNEEAPGAARGIECGLPNLDEPAEIVDLWPVAVELRPPAGNDAVVPRPRSRGHAEAPE